MAALGAFALAACNEQAQPVTGGIAPASVPSIAVPEGFASASAGASIPGFQPVALTPATAGVGNFGFGQITNFSFNFACPTLGGPSNMPVGIGGIIPTLGCEGNSFRGRVDNVVALFRGTGAFEGHTLLVTTHAGQLTRLLVRNDDRSVLARA
ncbi:MAG: hypothetical protein K2X11_13000 [Acetobacteraceae bacterium]|nr:hypothetical protein [Acetobacteraceae bacterium]